MLRKMHTENSVNANNIGEEGGYENHKERDRHHQHARVATLKASGLPCEPVEGPFDRNQHEEHPADTSHENPKRVETR